MSDNSNDTIWHYTSMESMLQILQNGTLRLSSAAHLNDSKEISWVNEIWDAAPDRESPENLDESSVALLSSCIIDQAFAERISPLIACFSFQGDKLSQWRSYADDGKGIALGFDRAWLMDNIDSQHTNNGLTIFSQPISYLSYGDTVKSIYDTFLRICTEYRTRFRFVDDTKKINHLANYFIKNSAFEEEEEFRICYDSGSFDPNNTTYTQPRQNFRTNKVGRIVPYVDLRIWTSENKPPISKIILGPRNENSVQLLKKYFWMHGNSMPTISSSRATYRS